MLKTSCAGSLRSNDRDAWSEHQPSAQKENKFIRTHGFGEYGKWHLRVDDEHDEQTKQHYKFPYGDFKKVHRWGVLSAESRAGQYKYFDIEKATAHLHGMIDAAKPPERGRARAAQPLRRSHGRRLQPCERFAASLGRDRYRQERHERLNDLIGGKLYDLLVIGVRNACYNGRDIIMEPDLPLTEAFLERMQDFRRYDEQIGLKEIFEQLSGYPPLERALSADLQAMLPAVAGTLTMLARETMKVIDPDVKHPDNAMWTRC